MRASNRYLPLRWAVCCLAALLSQAFVSAARAELPVEQPSEVKLPPADAYRIYLSDPVMPHLVDGRTYAVDGKSLRFLGLMGTGYAGSTALSRDGKTFYVATTYYSRLVRGTRADVVEAHRTDDLGYLYEIEIPPKQVQSLPMRALLTTSADDRFLLVQNATPATSVTVVDLQAKRVTTEIPTPGCYGVIAWPSQPRRFSSVCGDGKLATYDLDDKGVLAASSVTEPFFDPDKDPVFMHYELVGDELTFVSYLGAVHTIQLSGAKPTAAPPWSMLDAAARKQGWRPGGYQLFAIEPRSGRLYVGMHDKGAEGSHKTPAKEIWVVDLKSHKRVGRIPGQVAISMNIARTETPRLYLLSGADNRIVAFDLKGERPPTKPSARSEPVGETPVFIGMQ